MATMAMIGDWFEGSEWAEAFVAAGIPNRPQCKALSVRSSGFSCSIASLADEALAGINVIIRHNSQRMDNNKRNKMFLVRLLVHSHST